MTSNIDLLRTYIADAPAAIIAQLSGISYPIGAKGDGYAICQSCVSRIHRRGCSLPGNTEIVWSDTGSLSRCDLEDYHW